MSYYRETQSSPSRAKELEDDLVQALDTLMDTIRHIHEEIEELDDAITKLADPTKLF
ncbi:hypothetical protein AB4383_09015 [Vibrio breoganii]|uniref:hypothetical protein n=1 Tax=Vibrio breoganii TaxID=553239 RepID=UPI00355054C0